MQAYIIVEGRLERTESAEVIRAAHADGRTLWVDLGEHTQVAEQLLIQTFGVHPLVVEDIFREHDVGGADELGAGGAPLPVTRSDRSGIPE